MEEGQSPTKSTRNIMYTPRHRFQQTDSDPGLLVMKKKDLAMDWWYEENGGAYMKPLTDVDMPKTVGFMAY
jgi:hypothetical protein